VTPTHLFRVVWPLVDPTVPAEQIAAEIAADLPHITAETRVRRTGPGRFYLAPADRTPGSRGTTRHVLIYEAPARPAPRRDYHP
jgi:hypothetical protein